jgi:homoserine dehydrogenase
MFVPGNSQLANIDDVFNGIMVRGDCTGDVVFYGRGAGKLPTASAVVADIVDSIKHIKSRKYLFWTDSDNSSVLPFEKSVRAMYVRGVTDDKEAAYDRAAAVFGDIHRLSKDNAPEGEIAFITEPLPYEEFESKLNELSEIKAESVITFIYKEISFICLSHRLSLFCSKAVHPCYKQRTAK